MQRLLTNQSSPAVAWGKVYVGASAGFLAIVDAGTGQVMKKVPGTGGVITAPALGDNAVFFSTLNGSLTKIDREGKVLWTFRGGRPARRRGQGARPRLPGLHRG
jgi:outer membrane protein assembly factor BamB